MMKRFLTSTAVIAVLAATPALAADEKKMDRKADQAQSQTMNQNAGTFVTAQGENDWLGSTLIGRSVVNNEGDSIGDINNIVLNEQGNVDAVVIGVGGFLGIGEKDVGVKFSALEFRKDEAQEAAYKQAGKPMNPAMNPADAEKMRKSDTTQKTADERRQALANQRPDTAATDREIGGRGHSDMVIVLNMTKEQLESAPSFTYLDEKQDRTNPDTQNARPEDRSGEQKKQ